MDLVGSVQLADPPEGQGLDGDLLDLDPVHGVDRCSIGGRELVELGDHEEGHDALALVADRRHGEVSRATELEAGDSSGQGLDVDAVPATLVEGAGHRADVGVTGADVDVEALVEVTEGSVQQDVLAVLGVGDEAHAQAVPRRTAAAFIEYHSKLRRSPVRRSTCGAQPRLWSRLTS